MAPTAIRLQSKYKSHGSAGTIHGITTSASPALRFTALNINVPLRPQRSIYYYYYYYYYYYII